MAEKTVTAAELVAAFDRLRDLWKRLFDEHPGAGTREDVERQIREDLDIVAAVARVSAEAQPFIELAYLVRLDDWRIEGAKLDSELEDSAEALRSGLEMRLRTLRQIESGDEVLSDAGREIRRTAARDLIFFGNLRRLLRGEPVEGNDTLTPDRLRQTFDPRRKLVREEVGMQTPALEAVEFLVRLGAG